VASIEVLTGAFVAWLIAAAVVIAVAASGAWTVLL
jgi:hypothetical protein